MDCLEECRGGAFAHESLLRPHPPRHREPQGGAAAARAALLSRLLARGRPAPGGAACSERDWDASTCAGSEGGRSSGARSLGCASSIGGLEGAARDVLRLAPQLREVHSARSVHGMLARQEAAGGGGGGSSD